MTEMTKVFFGHLKKNSVCDRNKARFRRRGSQLARFSAKRQLNKVNRPTRIRHKGTQVGAIVASAEFGRTRQ